MVQLATMTMSAYVSNAPAALSNAPGAFSNAPGYLGRASLRLRVLSAEVRIGKNDTSYEMREIFTTLGYLPGDQSDASFYGEDPDSETAQWRRCVFGKFSVKDAKIMVDAKADPNCRHVGYRLLYSKTTFVKKNML